MSEQLKLEKYEQLLCMHTVRGEDRSRIGDVRGAQVDSERAARLRARTQPSDKAKR
jgi:hypothetical protein